MFKTVVAFFAIVILALKQGFYSGRVLSKKNKAAHNRRCAYVTNKLNYEWRGCFTVITPELVSETLGISFHPVTANKYSVKIHDDEGNPCSRIDLVVNDNATKEQAIKEMKRFLIKTYRVNAQCHVFDFRF